MQGSLQSLFQTLSYAVGIVVHRAEDFTWLMAASASVVAAAAGLFTAFVLRVRTEAGFVALQDEEVESAALEMGKRSASGSGPQETSHS